MTPLDIDRLREVDDFESLVEFLTNELDWPLHEENIEDLAFEYEPQELGFSEEIAVKIRQIKQLRPLALNQPWGIFYIDFEPKKLPVIVLRRVLRSLVIKKSPSSQKSNMPGWQMNDLLFINSFGETEDRNITFAHFKKEDEDQLPTLKVIGWDGQDTPLHLDRCLNELGHLRFDPDADPDTWRQSWAQAFTTAHRHAISTSKKLAQELARLAKAIRSNAEHVLKYESENGPFKKAMAKFKTALIHDLTEEDFADMYAQTIAYGLLYTAIRSHVAGEPTQVSADRVQQLVLPTNPFLKEVMEDFFNIGTRKWDSDKEMLTGVDFDELGVNAIITTLKDERTDFDAILRDFGNRNPNEDPVIHFYELFLKEYDKQKRKSRGVYYTPQPVVSFIVRSVHEVLKRDFNLPLGLADTTTWAEMIQRNPDIKLPEGVSEDEYFVQILDPAIGTGTFLVETIDLIYKTMTEHWQSQGKSETERAALWNRYVPDCLLPRLFGFELMMAPYAIAHMKIGIKLYETGYANFEQDQKRVQVYLTNTLEEAVDTSGYLDTLDPALALETEQANILKTKDSITVIIGNPPYSGLSFNMNPWIDGLLKGQIPNGPKVRSYYEVDGKPLGERKLWLQDDYVKFIRYAQFRLDNTGIGVLGFITNHAYLDNPTFRGMRQALLESFNNLHFIDLHGNAKRKEKSPDGSVDKNVFDIQQGVGICLLRNTTNSVQPLVSYTSFWGSRENKYALSLQNTIYTIDHDKPTPNSPYYFFVPREEANRDEYETCCKISDIMAVNVTGILTARDKFAIDFEEKKLSERMKVFTNKSLSDSGVQEKYSLSENYAWRVSVARNNLAKALISSPANTFIKPILYRPFDIKKIFYQKDIVWRMRDNVMRHILAGENRGLITSRINRQVSLNYFFVSSGITDFHILDNARDSTSLFPCYLYPEEGHMPDRNWPAGKNGRTPNFDPKFVGQFAGNIGLEFVPDGKGDLKNTFGPEDIFNYIYAVFHGPTYRSRYAEFLKIDFPRVPMTSNVDMFRLLCGLGCELVALHLMESDKLDDRITTFPVSGDNAVIKVGETRKQLAEVENGKGKLYINPTQYFDNLSEEVWNFHIGGYQVCYKWLYDRKKAGRKLSAEDIDHYHRIVVVLNETIKLMAKIDETIEAHGGWPIK